MILLYLNAECFVSLILVNIQVPARYGYEYLLIELSKMLKEKIFIRECDVFEQYSSISHLNSCVTNNQDVRIFLEPTYLKFDRKHSDDCKNYLNLQLSAMFWMNWNGGSFVHKTGPNSYRVCYATHNSYEETRELLSYLKPKKVYLNVLSEDAEEKLEMLNLVNHIQKQYSIIKSEMNKDSFIQTKFSFKRLRLISKSAHNSK